MSTLRYSLFATVLAVLTACGGRSPFVVLTVEDPQGLATAFSAIAVGATANDLIATIPRARTFPLELTITSATSGNITLWAEARDSAGTVLARGMVLARFATKGTPTAAIVLERPCTADADCDDGVFCNGQDSCDQGLCATTAPPCGANFPCVTSACVELRDGRGDCSVTIDHSVCSDDEYCNPAAGCVVGQGCHVSTDCHDDSVCNGEEECINFVCRAGRPPATDDSEVCTLDGCSETNGVFHVLQISFDGLSCELPGGAGQGICLERAGGCVLSTCGDGYTDQGKGEVCDEGTSNRAEWGLDAHCDTSCTRMAPYCGDRVVTSPEEHCDDGDQNDSNNGCDAVCKRNASCGDGDTQVLFEQCDDTDSNDCNGCRNDCTNGCICGQSCDWGMWCSADGLCNEPCTIASHCGDSCATCPQSRPVCNLVGDSYACQCVASPQDSCGYGSRCDSGTCTPCNTAIRCGQECTACNASGDTPVCGGAEVGCITTDCTAKADFTPCQVVTNPDRSYDICLTGVCVSPGCGDRSCGWAGPSYATSQSTFVLNDSGQWPTCYDTTAALTSCPGDTESYFGQDAQYGWDTLHAASERFTRSYEVTSEPLIQDHVTSLSWQGCPAGLRGANCDVDSVFSMTWSNALAYCDQLPWGGYTDWRLPEVNELFSLSTYDRVSPASDAEVFIVVPSYMNAFWSSTVCSTDALSRLTVSFLRGELTTADDVPGSTRHVRCVRGRPQPRPLGHYAVAGTTTERVIEDLTTRLAWQGCAAGKTGATCETGSPLTINWQDALNYCTSITWGGYSDWVLPNVVQLETLVDHSNSVGIDTSVFLSPPSAYDAFWSSTTTLSDLRMAWVMYGNGRLDYLTVKDTGAEMLRCVRQIPP